MTRCAMSDGSQNRCGEVAVRKRQSSGAATHGVRRAWPVGQRTFGSTSGTSRHATRSCGPAARWIAPSTPPPPSRRSFAAGQSRCLNSVCDDEVSWKPHAEQKRRIAECRNKAYSAADTEVGTANDLPALRMPFRHLH